jgi:hypothetical protein
MARLPRYVPPQSLVEATTRTIQGRLLLRPSRDLNEIVYGILARAAKLYDVKVCAFIFLSNHYHLLLVPADTLQLARFMGYLDGQLAKEAGRLHHWRERFWGRRYQSILVSEELEVQEARLYYVLENGCKENLVRSPREWPGATSTHALLRGEPIRGVWFDRTAEYEARRSGERVAKYDCSEDLELDLVPLPAWSHLSASDIRQRVAAMVRTIEHDTRTRAKQTGRSPLGPRRVCRQNPHATPEHVSRSPAPRFHAHDPSVRERLAEAIGEFLTAYRRASEALRRGDYDVAFPPCCFKPSSSFVPALPAAGYT